MRISEQIAVAATLVLVSGVLFGTLPMPAAAHHSTENAGARSGGVMIASFEAGRTPLNPLSLQAAPGLGVQARILVNSSDPAVVPNTGLQLNITGYTEPSSLSPNASFQVGAEEVLGNFSAVFGFFQNTLIPTTAFFSVFTNRTNQNIVTSYWSQLTFLPANGYDFELVHQTKGIWELTVNGQPFGGNASSASFNFGVSAATWATGISFSEIAFFQTSSPVPTFFTVPLAFAVLAPTGWYLPQNGRAYFLGSQGPQWGTQGRIQHTTLAPGELECGSNVPVYGSGGSINLWTGGPVRVIVSETLSPAIVVGLSTATSTVTVTDSNGAPIPGTYLYLTDSTHSTFLPPTVLTAGSGVTHAFFLTPNVTRAVTDLVTATVTLFGYFGFAASSINITPAEQILLDYQPSNPTVAPNGFISITFIATDHSGLPVPGVLLSFELNGAGNLSAPSAITGAGGSASAGLSAPGIGTTVRLTALVASEGQWGQVTLNVRVSPPSPSFFARYGADLLEAGLAALAVVLIVVWIVRRRRRQRSLPATPLREYLRERRAAETQAIKGLGGEPPPAENEAATSRTPPGSDNP